ncbi:tyrosine-type recombinase/integrase [Aquisediminimonas profunda]|uniref:tyrosine-type recombinase/integrase n=1 Tax=Aquisediminimonas profunda TaxID=1550733 RepID=UPI001C62DB01|nr:site-specific integrase [Aquisediminimonas profunda]
MPVSYKLVPYRGKLAVAFGTGSSRIRLSTGTNDKGLAEARAKLIWSSLNKPGSDRVEDLWATYVQDRSKEIADLSRLKYAWKVLGPFFADRMGHTIDHDLCREYARNRKRLGRADSTVRIELEYLRACLNLRYGRGNTHVWTPPQSKPRSRYLTKAELEKLLDRVSTPHIRLFIILAVTTGARMKSILGLKWEQVDFTHRAINYAPAGRHQTNKRETEVPMNGRALMALEEAVPAALTDYVIEWDGQPVKSVKKAIRGAAARSGVPCSPHVFRHTAGVWMAQSDVPMQKIAQFLGHTSTRVTERTYARYSPSFMRDAAAALDW